MIKRDLKPNKFTQLKKTKSRFKLMKKSLKAKKNLERDSNKPCDLRLEQHKDKLHEREENNSINAMTQLDLAR